MFKRFMEIHAGFLREGIAASFKVDEFLWALRKGWGRNN